MRRGFEVNGEELAEAVGTSTNTIREWRSPNEFEGGLPVKQQGGNGKPYVYDLDKCVDWVKRRREHFETVDAEKQQAISAAQEELELEGGSGDDETAGLSSRQRTEYYNAELARNKAALERGELIEADKVSAEFEETFQMTARFLQALPDNVERDIGLDPAAVEAMRQSIDAFQATLARELMRRGNNNDN